MPYSGDPSFRNLQERLNWERLNRGRGPRIAGYAPIERAPVPGPVTRVPAGGPIFRVSVQDITGRTLLGPNAAAGLGRNLIAGARAPLPPPLRIALGVGGVLLTASSLVDQIPKAIDGVKRTASQIWGLFAGRPETRGVQNPEVGVTIENAPSQGGQLYLDYTVKRIRRDDSNETCYDPFEASSTTSALFNTGNLPLKVETVKGNSIRCGYSSMGIRILSQQGTTILSLSQGITPCNPPCSVTELTGNLRFPNGVPNTGQVILDDVPIDLPEGYEPPPVPDPEPATEQPIRRQSLPSPGPLLPLFKASDQSIGGNEGTGSEAGSGGNNTAENPAVGNATGSQTRSGNQRVTGSAPLSQSGAVPKKAGPLVTTNPFQDWFTGKPFADPPERLKLGLNLGEGFPLGDLGDLFPPQTLQRIADLIQPRTPIPFPRPVVGTTPPTKPPGGVDQLTTPRPGSGPSQTPRTPGNQSRILVTPGGSTPTNSDGTPAPQAPPAPPNTPGGVTFYQGKPFGGGGGSPRPDLVSMADELGRIERKLGSMLNPTPDTGTELWNDIKTLIEVLSNLSDFGTYTVREVCPYPQGEEPQEWNYPWGGSYSGFGNITSRLDAIALMLQKYKELDQPVCKHKPTGQPVTVQFIESYDT